MEKSMLFIGLIEDDNCISMLKIISSLLKLSGYNKVYENINGDIVVFCNGYRMLILFELVTKDLNDGCFNNFSFDVIVNSSVSNCDYNYINKILKMSKVCILNTDESDLTILLSELEDIIVITYGYNSKATVTISSYNIDQYIEANLFLQRDLTPLHGEKIEPFEFLLELTSTNKDYIYPLLAASTLNLCIGDSVLNMKPYKNIKITI